MYELKAKKGTHVKIHAQMVDETTAGQIVQIANHPAESWLDVKSLSMYYLQRMAFIKSELKEVNHD